MKDADYTRRCEQLRWMCKAYQRKRIGQWSREVGHLGSILSYRECHDALMRNDVLYAQAQAILKELEEE